MEISLGLLSLVLFAAAAPADTSDIKDASQDSVAAARPVPRPVSVSPT